MTFGFLRTVVTDAIIEWEQAFPNFSASYIHDHPDSSSQLTTVSPEKQELQTIDEPPQNPTTYHPCKASDAMRASCLKSLKRYQCMSFDKWTVDEVFVYTLMIFPRKDFVYLTRKGFHSEFLHEIFIDWLPSLYEWMSFLWKFCGHAHEFYGDVITLMPEDEFGTVDELARVLFSEMDLTRAAAASVAGALVPFPCENTFAIQHATDLFLLMNGLGPRDAGRMCCSLILYRIMMRSGCHCGYEAGQENCNCQLDDVMDNDKEYARVLYSLVLADHTEAALRVKDQWSQEERSEFIREACEYVFSEHAYTAIHQQMFDGVKPTTKQKHPRILKDWETKQDVYKKDGYEDFMKNQIGCVIPGCPQMTKKECTNATCKTHCCEIGMRECRVHRHYTPCPWPVFPWRKSIQPDLIESHGP
eukprot:GFKZ01000715.1.p1 GENE.GFKZ01000715.1~~GFKZ01000715.1.p1  ORF type:complete len:416 (+),score=33.06 GFKZ01000715.1:221-1468(+)